MSSSSSEEAPPTTLSSPPLVADDTSGQQIAPTSELPPQPLVADDTSGQQIAPTSELPPQPLNVLTMSGKQICKLISATHAPDDENFDADSLFVDVKNILKRATRIVDNVLLGQEHPENLAKKVSRASFDPLLCTLEQLSSEMAGKAPGVEIAHKTTMSIIGKLSNYSWNVKPALTLAAFALDYEDFFALPQLCSSHQLVESVENPKHVYVTLKHLDLQKYGKTIAELNKIINDTLDVMEVIFEWNKWAKKDSGTFSSMVMDLVKEGVYWIIITVVACKTQMCCLTSNDDKTQDLLPLAKKMISTCRSEIDEKKERRKLKEALQAPDEIMEVFKVLIFARDDMQPLIDGSTNEMVSIDVLKNKDVLLFISSLDISNNDISELMPIYDGIMMGDQYKIVWIPIVKQWTDDLRKKFEMLWSKMPWYIVQYFSPVAGLKFIKEELWFDNEPIVVVMNPQGELENENALHEIQRKGMEAFPFSRWCLEPKIYVMKPPGPYAIEEYSFLYGGNDNKWVEQFSKKVISVAEDPVIKEEYISIELSRVGKGHKPQRFWKPAETQKKTKSNRGSQKIQELLLSFKNESKWAVLTKWSTRVVSDHGMTILKVLEVFEEWKVNVPKRGFEICFKEYHDKLHQTGPPPYTSRNA